jgi:hypothetical protein
VEVGGDPELAVVEAIQRKIAGGKNPTAADMEFLRSWRERKNSPPVEVEKQEEDFNGGATLEEDLEEWTLRDGVVRGQYRRLSALARAHQVESVEKVLWRVQRGLLKAYGWEGSKKSGALAGNEALALMWVKSIGQLARASRQWELKMDEAERSEMGFEFFQGLVMTLKQLADKRDNLAFKVRELSAKEKKAGTGRGQRAHSIEIVMMDGGEGGKKKAGDGAA